MRATNRDKFCDACEAQFTRADIKTPASTGVLTAFWLERHAGRGPRYSVFVILALGFAVGFLLSVRCVFAVWLGVVALAFTKCASSVTHNIARPTPPTIAEYRIESSLTLLLMLIADCFVPLRLSLLLVIYAAKPVANIQGFVLGGQVILLRGWYRCSRHNKKDPSPDETGFGMTGLR